MSLSKNQDICLRNYLISKISALPCVTGPVTFNSITFSFKLVKTTGVTKDGTLGRTASKSTDNNKVSGVTISPSPT